MKNVGIVGLGIYLPQKIVTNRDLEAIIETSDEWIKTRTGIEERRIADDDTDTSDMATFAAINALKESNLNSEDIDMIIVATATPDHAFPSVACQVQDKIGAKNAYAFDISVACSGFIYALITAKNYIQTGDAKNVLVIGAEKLSKLIDWKDRNTAVLFGDGAGAVVLSEVSNGKGILSHELGSDGTGGKFLLTDKITNFISMNGREVFKFAVRQMPESSLNVVEKAGLKKEDVDFLVPHQANIRIIDAARERLGLSEDKVSTTVKMHGNTSAASIPLALFSEIEKGKIKDNDILVMVGFGGGLTWGSLCMKWGK